MHGYEIIRHLEDKSHGLWRPSPGSVYPTLQLLEEQDLVTAADHNGKKVYELTDKGRAEAKSADQKTPWEWDDEQLARIREIKGAIVGVIGPFKTVARAGDEANFKQALQIMEVAHQQLTALAKEDPSAK
jgi:DNA-binding PadR family transcriptional regulator